MSESAAPAAAGEVERKPVAAYAVYHPTLGVTETVVCDDGSAWYFKESADEWRELPPIPGTARAHALATPQAR